MRTQLFFVQGGGSGAYKEDRKLADSLQAALGNSYRVLYPRMPREADPDYKLWKVEIAGHFAKTVSPRLLVGHSVGGAMILKYLSENPNIPITALFLLAAPYVGADETWRDDAVQVNFKKLRHIRCTFLYHCRDDKVVPFEHLALYSSSLSGARVRRFRSGGHQFRNRLFEIATDIERTTHKSSPM